MKKTAAESHRILVGVYGDHAVAERTCQKWFGRFKSGDFGLEDEERPGQPKKFENEELEALLDEDCCQTQEELTKSLGVTQADISKRLTINRERYRTQLIRLKREIDEKRLEYATRHKAIIFHQCNAQPHVAIQVNNYLENSGWEVSPHPPYSLDLVPSDYNLFRSMQNAVTGIRFTSEQGIKNWLDSFLAAKPVQFFWDGIHKLPERWEKVIASDGQYFE